MDSDNPKVGIVMGSDSDWPLVQKACATLDGFGVPYETRVISAHRTPELALEYSRTDEARGRTPSAASSRLPSTPRSERSLGMVRNAIRAATETSWAALSLEAKIAQRQGNFEIQSESRAILVS